MPRRCWRGSACARGGPLLEAYTHAFAHYLRTGTVGALSRFCDADADLSRLRVYRNGFLRACIEALRANYPSVDRLVGEERFPALARPWVEAHPPRAATLVEYGEGFAQYIDDTRDTHRLDWLAAFAALDRAWTEVQLAGDDEAEAAPRAGVPDDAAGIMGLRGRLSPRVRLVSLEYRVLGAWGRVRRGALGQRTELRSASQQVLVWREGVEMLYRDLAAPEHAFIAGVAAGLSCGEAAGAALGIDADFDLAAAFASLLHRRMLTFEH